MDFQLKRVKGNLILRSGLAMNIAFILPTGISLGYMISSRTVTVWTAVITLMFIAGMTYRERWIFSAEEVSFRFSLFALPLKHKSLSPGEVKAVQLKTFIRGENEAVKPGSDRKWFQTEQGLLKLIKTDETEETLMIDTNKKNLKLLEKGEAIATFLQVSFLINENGPA